MPTGKEKAAHDLHEILNGSAVEDAETLLAAYKRRGDSSQIDPELEDLIEQSCDETDLMLLGNDIDPTDFNRALSADAYRFDSWVAGTRHNVVDMNGDAFYF